MRLLFTLLIGFSSLFAKSVENQPSFELLPLPTKEKAAELKSYQYEVLGKKNKNTYLVGDTLLLDVTLMDFSDYDSVYIYQNEVLLAQKQLTPQIFHFLNASKEPIQLLLKGKTEKKVTLNWTIAKEHHEALITNDAITLGILILVLLLIFYTEGLKSMAWFYKVVPGLLLCYFIPAILNSLGIIDGHGSNLYFVSSRYLLPASLILLTLSVDIQSILKLGPKALIMFFTATLGIMLGGPIALLAVAKMNPEVLYDLNGHETWRGLATVAGSWIGGGANQTAMKEIYGTPESLFQKMIVVDVVVANIWMAILLLGTGMKAKVDKWLKADSSAITELEEKMEKFQGTNARNTSFMDLMKMAGIAFGGVAIAHLLASFFGPSIKAWLDAGIKADPDSWLMYLTSFGKEFFWIVIIATIFGLIMSFTKSKQLEGAGASKLGSVFLYILVASIGMHMNIAQLIEEWSDFKFLFAVGLLWMLVHIIILLLVAKLVKAPFFFVAVGSQANVGGAASAPVVASAFNPALAPVGVLLAVLGYVVGTFGAIVCASLMEAVTHMF